MRCPLKTQKFVDVRNEACDMECAWLIGPDNDEDGESWRACAVAFLGASSAMEAGRKNFRLPIYRKGVKNDD